VGDHRGANGIGQITVEHTRPIAHTHDRTAPDRRFGEAPRGFETDQSRARRHGSEPARGNRADEPNLLGPREQQADGSGRPLAGQPVQSRQRGGDAGEVIARVRVQHPLVNARQVVAAEAPAPEVACHDGASAILQTRHDALEGLGLRIERHDPRGIDAARAIANLDRRVLEVRIVHAAAELQHDLVAAGRDHDERGVIQVGRDEDGRRFSG